jgi:hypothetical protein
VFMCYVLGRGEVHICVYVLCLGGVRFIYVFMCYVLGRGEVHICVYVLVTVTKKLFSIYKVLL